MNNPHNLTQTERAITPVAHFNKGINHQMSKERRRAKQKRYADNASLRLQKSQNKH